MDTTLRELLKKDVDFALSLEYFEFLNYDKELIFLVSERNIKHWKDKRGYYGPYRATPSKNNLDIPLILSEEEVLKIKDNSIPNNKTLVAVWSEHDGTDTDSDIVSLEVSPLIEGAWLLSCSDNPTNFCLRGIYEDYNLALQKKESIANKIGK
jgi:hypothetical protein